MSTPLPTPHTAAQYPDDEIDLYELFQSIWQEKMLVALITAVVTVLALTYAVLATPVYQVQGIVRPATLKDLDELNGTGIYNLSRTEALNMVGESLESYGTRLNFFKANQPLFENLFSANLTPEQVFDRLNRENLKLLTPPPVKKDTDEESFSKYVGIQLEYTKEVDGPAIVNGLIQHAIDLERAKVLDDLAVIIENKLERLQRGINVARVGYEANKEIQIAKLTEEDKLKKAQLTDELNALREELKARRLNRITHLEEAITIAEAMGIKKPSTPYSLDKDLSSARNGNVILTEVNNQQNQYPLYFMGSEALNAERATLLARTDDDFTSGRIVEIHKELKLLENNRRIETLHARENEDLFLSEIADHRKEINRLNNLKVDMDKLKIVQIDQQAVQPTSAIKPNKKLIVAIGLVLGGMLGLFAALIRSMIRKRQAQVAG